MIITYISRFAKSIRKARSTLYRDKAEEPGITEIKGDREMSANLGNWRSVLESGIRWCKAMSKVHVRQWETKTRKLIRQDYAESPEIVCQQRSMSHFVFECTKCAHRWRKWWLELDSKCGDMAGVLNFSRRSKLWQFFHSGDCRIFQSLCGNFIRWPNRIQQGIRDLSSNPSPLFLVSLCVLNHLLWKLKRTKYTNVI